LAGPWDIVVSNILSGTLIGLARETSQRLAPSGSWIVSGIIAANWPDVLEAAQDAGLRLDSLREEDGWVAARLVHRENPVI
jgi:ribosomal protein L11 methyltransferase